MTTLKEKAQWTVLRILEFVAVLCIILFALIVVSCSTDLLNDCFSQIYVFLFATIIIIAIKLMIETVIKEDEEDIVHMTLLMGTTNILMAYNCIIYIVIGTDMLTSNTCDGGLIYASIITSLGWFMRYAFLPTAFFLTSSTYVLACFLAICTKPDDEEVEKNSLEESLI